MSSELLIELFSEEVPVKLQKQAISSYNDIFRKYFQNLKIEVKDSDIAVYAGSKRITIYVKNLPKEITHVAKEIRGPGVGADPRAIEGFCRSNNITRTDLTIENKYYFYQPKEVRENLIKIFEKSLHEAISEHVWSQSMYWGSHQCKWVRPLRNILCIFDGKIVPIRYHHLVANNITYGHRLLSPNAITVTNFDEYQKQLKENYIIFDHSVRQSEIKKQIEDEVRSISKEKSAEYSLYYGSNDDLEFFNSLLEEVTGLVEYPVILRGEFDEKFLQLPKEVIALTVKKHQKCFLLEDENGEIAKYFLIISNVKLETQEKEHYMIRGYQKVITARLEDALYFWNEDLKTTLKEKANKLDLVTFHPKLGTMSQKIHRMQNILKFFCKNNILSNLDNDNTENNSIEETENNSIENQLTDLSIPRLLKEATEFCKADLVSESVNELPELQGIIGYYFAKEEKLDQVLAEMMRNQPNLRKMKVEILTSESQILAIADNIDSICGLFAAGEYPTGNKDNFAQRRMVLDIIKIILVHSRSSKIFFNKIDINQLIYFSLKQYNIIENDLVFEQLHKKVLKFFEQRLKYYFHDRILTSEGKILDQDNIINATINLTSDFEHSGNLLLTEQKILVLMNEYQSLQEIYLRIHNIVGSNIDCNINTDLMKLDPEQSEITALNDEQALYLHLRQKEKILSKLSKEFSQTSATNSDINIVRQKCNQYVSELLSFKNPIEKFFNNYIINDSNHEIRNNRIALLNKIKRLFDDFARFDCDKVKDCDKGKDVS